MTPSLLLTAVSMAYSVGLAPAPDQAITYLDLKPKFNQKLKETFHGGAFKENNLADVPSGKQKFGEVTFNIEEGLIQVNGNGASNPINDMPAKVEGIKVDQAFGKLHILHATGYVAEEGVVIGSYVIHYADETTEKIEIVYGQDVCDWWYGDGDKEPSKGKVAWKGENPPSKSIGKKIRLYMMTWKNPKPDKKVATIDFIAEDKTPCAPFCLAMTVE